MSKYTAHDLDRAIVESPHEVMTDLEEVDIISDSELLLTQSDGTKYRVTIELIPSDLTVGQVRALGVGAVIGISCRACEGHEPHEKLPDFRWKCLNCGHRIEI